MKKPAKAGFLYIQFLMNNNDILAKNNRENQYLIVYLKSRYILRMKMHLSNSRTRRDFDLFKLKIVRNRTIYPMLHRLTDCVTYVTFKYMDPTKKIYSVKEIADLLGVTRVTVFRWIKSGKLKASKIGKTYIVSVENLPHHLLGGLSEEKKTMIKEVVKKALDEYRVTFEKLSKE